MFHQTHRLCPACDARVKASATQCPDCSTKLTPIRRIDTVRVTLAVMVLLVLAGGATWAVTTKDLGGRDRTLVAPRDWWHADSTGLAIDSAVAGMSADDTTETPDSVLVMTGGRTEGCEPYVPPPPSERRVGRSGPVSITNQSTGPILLTIYHPDGEGWSTIQRRLPPGRSTFLTVADGKRAIAYGHWGVQVNAFCVEPFDRVAGWTGDHFTITWAGSGEGER